MLLLRWGGPQPESPHLPQILNLWAGDPLYGTEREALSNQHKRTHRSTKRVLIIFAVINRTYISDAVARIQLYDTGFYCRWRDKMFHSCNSSPLIGSPCNVFSRNSENLSVVNIFRTCTEICYWCQELMFDIYIYYGLLGFCATQF